MSDTPSSQPDINTRAAPHDVPFIWIISYPKSGNTWMRTLLRNYIVETRGEKPFESNDVSQYWYQTVSPRPLTTLEELETVQLRPAAMMHLQTLQKFRQKPRPAAVVKSHFVSGEFQGISFFSPLWVDAAVYIYRDPRDILPSLADHMGKTLDEAADMMSQEKSTLGSLKRGKLPSPLSTWSNHVMSWHNQSRIPLITTSYEKMHEDTAGQLRRVVAHAGLGEIDEEAIERAVELSRFDRLRKQEDEGAFLESTEHQERFFRRGKVGSHRDEVPERLIKKIESDHRTVMGMLGYGSSDG